MARVLEAVLQLVFAPACAVCDEALTTPSRGPVCDACWDAVPVDTAADLATWTTDAALRVTCAARYDGSMRGIVRAFKFGGHQSLATGLAARIRAHPDLHLEEVDVVVPVPLHPWRRFSRGFNQAECIARHLGPPVLLALARWQWRPSQTSLGAADRRRNLRHAITLAPRVTVRARDALRTRLRDARVLLVDDVVTTGATMAACAAVLREAGVREVRGAAAARTPLQPR